MKIIQVLYLFFSSVVMCNGFLVNLDINKHLVYSKIFYKKTTNPYGKKYYEDLLIRKKEKEIQKSKTKKLPSMIIPLKFKYPVSKLYFEEQLKRLNSQNITLQNNGILNRDTESEHELEYEPEYEPEYESEYESSPI